MYVGDSLEETPNKSNKTDFYKLPMMHFEDNTL